MMCGLLSSHADPTSAPPAEQIPMGRVFKIRLKSDAFFP